MLLRRGDSPLSVTLRWEVELPSAGPAVGALLSGRAGPGVEAGGGREVRGGEGRAAVAREARRASRLVLAAVIPGAGAAEAPGGAGDVGPFAALGGDAGRRRSLPEPRPAPPARAAGSRRLAGQEGRRPAAGLDVARHGHGPARPRRDGPPALGARPADADDGADAVRRPARHVARAGYAGRVPG